MKKLTTVLLILLIQTILYGQTKQIDQENLVLFKIKNAGMTVDGSFKGLAGTILFDPKNLPGSSFDVTIDANTVNTDNKTRDGHLRKKEYFDVVTYPKIRFKSKKIQVSGTGYSVTGDLTIKGKTKEITMMFTYTDKNTTGTFNGSFTINRLNFEVGDSSWILSDDVTILLNINVTNQ